MWLKGSGVKAAASPAESGQMRESWTDPRVWGWLCVSRAPPPHLHLCGPPLTDPPQTCQFPKEKRQKGLVLVACIIAAVLEKSLSQRGIAKILSLLLHMFLLNLQSCQTNYFTEPWNCVWACVHTAFLLTDAVFLMPERQYSCCVVIFLSLHSILWLNLFQVSLSF